MVIKIAVRNDTESVGDILLPLQVPINITNSPSITKFAPTSQLISLFQIKFQKSFSHELSEIRMWQYRDDDHREDAPHFSLFGFVHQPWRKYAFWWLVRWALTSQSSDEVQTDVDRDPRSKTG